VAGALKENTSNRVTVNGVSYNALTTANNEREFTSRIVAGFSWIFYSDYYVRFEPERGGTKLLHGEVVGGLGGGYFAWSKRKHVEAMLGQFNEELKAYVERGETVADRQRK